VFRNIGAFGDYLEWFGINTLVSLLPLYQNGQITGKDMLVEMAKSPLNKALGQVRPEVKAFAEIPAGKSIFPDVTQPRTIGRLEAAGSVLGLQDEVRLFRGWVLKNGERMRPYWYQRWAIGVVDPKKTALYEMYDLRERFLRKEGREQPPPQVISPFRPMREAAMNEDYKAFKEARAYYLKRGKGWTNFKASLGYLDPLGSQLNRKDEWRFANEFLTGVQRQKLDVGRRYAADLRALLVTWWLRAAEEEKAEAQGSRAKEAL
jgi:hypothetical protein